MNVNTLGSAAALSTYASSLLATQTSSSGSSSTSGNASTAAATPASTALKAAADAALAKASHAFKASNAQHGLAQKQTALAADLHKALSAAGVTLGGAVEFSIGSNGTLAISGSASDKQAIGTFLKNDKSRPSLASRVTALAGQADSLSQTIRQNAAISQAARYAGSAAGVMSIYSTLQQQQDATPAVFALTSTGSTLTYPGVLASTA